MIIEVGTFRAVLRRTGSSMGGSSAADLTLGESTCSLRVRQSASVLPLVSKSE